VFEELLPEKGIEMYTKKLYNIKGGDARGILDLCMIAIRHKIN